MKSSTRLDSAVFQLTPTRTRCDLVILANGKTEKVASGLLNPFLAHLKTAQDQMAKGGYTIILEPEHGKDVTWFTKGTVERFVRFVSTPEVLERVYTTESEILQIEEAIAIQSNNETGLSNVEEIPAKPVERIEGGSRPLQDTGEEKAIVLYKPGAHQPEANGSAVPEGNSKVQLLKVLETRKTVLRKEQGMAFARAVAAGFDIDNVAPLISFAESFGASRLMDACVRFVELWKRKHETGQWLEIEEAEAMSSQADFAALNASGIMLSTVFNKQKDEASENIGKADDKPPTDHQPPGHQEYFQGQFPHHMFPPWPIQSPPGAPPVFQGYSMQGLPYYQNYPANGPYSQSPYPSMEDARCNSGQRRGQRRHSMDSCNTVLETREMDGSKVGSQDDAELDKETSGKKTSRSGKKQSGMVVIRNINYITSKRQHSSANESQSTSNSDHDDEDEDIQSSTPEKKHKSALRSSKRRESHIQSVDTLQESGGQWQAFQNYLLRDADDEEERDVDKGMFTMERDVRARQRQNTVGDDPLVSSGRDSGEYRQGNAIDVHKVGGNMARMPKASSDELLISRRVGRCGDGRRLVDGQMDVQYKEIDGRRGVYRTTDDDFMIHRRENHSGITNSPSDMLPVNGFEGPTNNLDRRSPQNMDDDSYVVSLRSSSLDRVQTGGRNAVDMDTEFPTSRQKAENKSKRVGNQATYEPNELSLMPERRPEKGSTGYNPALDYEIQAHVKDGASLNKKNKQGATDVEQRLKKSDKDRKSKLMDTSDKKKTVGPIRKGKPSKLSPLDEARARAEKLRTYKADLQKMKKQKEEEEVRRLEALKIERQKRISARHSSIPAQSTLPSQQMRKQLPTKLSPSAHRGSKFSDSEPGPSSPLQRFPVRAASLGSSDPQKIAKPSKLNPGSHSGRNRLSRSISSLPEPKKENSGVTPDAKVSMARIRRLSEPKISSSQRISSAKPRSAEPISKSKASAIVNHDKNRAASLPGIKVRKSKEPEGTGQKKNKEKISHRNDVDDNLVIEKTVVMLEEKPSAYAAPTREENMEIQKGLSDNYKIKEKIEVVSDYVAIHAPSPPLTMDGIDKEPLEHQLQEQPAAYEVTNANSSNAVKESLKTSSVNVSGKQYQAPYARVSSLEDLRTRNSEYGRAPSVSIQTMTSGTDVVKAQVPDSKSLKLEKIPEALEKRQTKESSKGFRRLLKFGKRNQSSSPGDRSAESDNVTVNGSKTDNVVTTTASASKVRTLKTLISQDETPTGITTPQKSSRSFSLLSPFRSKTSEKKTMT